MEYKLDAIDSAKYCLGCKNGRCINACPLQNDITSMIECVKTGDIDKAYDILLNTTVFGSICGRICQHMCEKACVRGIKERPVDIGSIEAYVSDNDMAIPMLTDKKINKSVAIVGGGICGLTCASFLKRLGVERVVIFEKYNFLGGIVRHSIPDFRLDKKILDKNIKKILDLGIEVKYNMELDKNLTLDELTSSFDSVFLSFGANVSTKMGIPGEELEGVMGGNELLEYRKYGDFKEKKVCVIGGGNVAMDTSRTVKRLGADDVYVIYRRSQKEMPAEEYEIKEAKEEGIKFLFQTNILEIIGKNNVEKVKCIKTELVKNENDTRPYPVNIEGTEYFLDFDCVIMALGSKSDENVVKNLKVELNKKGKIVVDENCRTSIKGVYSGGDIVGAGNVSVACRQGRDAAESIVNDFMLN